MEFLVILYLIMGAIGLHHFYRYFSSRKPGLLRLSIYSIPVIVLCAYLTVCWFEPHLAGFDPEAHGLSRLKYFPLTPGTIFMPLFVAIEVVLFLGWLARLLFPAYSRKELFFIFLFLSSAIGILMLIAWGTLVPVSYC